MALLLRLHANDVHHFSVIWISTFYACLMLYSVKKGERPISVSKPSNLLTYYFNYLFPVSHPPFAFISLQRLGCPVIFQSFFLYHSDFSPLQATFFLYCSLAQNHTKPDRRHLSSLSFSLKKQVSFNSSRNKGLQAWETGTQVTTNLHYSPRTSFLLFFLFSFTCSRNPALLFFFCVHPCFSSLLKLATLV